MLSASRRFQRLAENAGVAHNALDVFLGDPGKYPDVPDVTDDPADSTAEPADAP